MNITDKYRAELQNLRRNPQLLSNYLFDGTANSKHFERLRLNIAIYNDPEPGDYHLVKFLFAEELKWREAPADGDVDNLYFCAFILTLFKHPEIIWPFWELKNLGFDSGIGFDGEYLVAAGIGATYEYVNTSDNADKQQLLGYIGRFDKLHLFRKAN